MKAVIDSSASNVVSLIFVTVYIVKNVSLEKGCISLVPREHAVVLAEEFKWYVALILLERDTCNIL